jgi:GTP-binding protein
VGRPNVGKSTLLNRLAARRRAIVGASPGLTRDLLDIEVTWRGRTFTLFDTGGLVAEALGEGASEGIGGKAAERALDAARDADVIVFVVDITMGATADDLMLARRLQRMTRPVLAVVNKADDPSKEVESSSLWELGFGEPVAVSGLHGRGTGDLLDRVVDLLPEGEPVPDELQAPALAIVGRPNVGKSSLFNRICADDRSIVHRDPGTTRDPVDTIVEVDGAHYRFIDTAGLRRRTKTEGIEIPGASRTLSSIRRADLAILVVDASEGATSQDQRIAREISENGAGAIVALNKWDLLHDPEAAEVAERSMTDRLHFVSYAPMVRTSALTGRGIERLLQRIPPVLQARRLRIPTARLNEVVREAQQRTPPPRVSGKRTKIRYATQVEADPPVIVLFSNAQPSSAWLKYLERRLREEFGFEGTPIRIKVRRAQGPARERRS